MSVTPPQSVMPAGFARQVESAVFDSPYLAGRQLRIEAESGHVILHGTVRSYFQKQMAQEALRKVSGVQRIDNRLIVSA